MKHESKNLVVPNVVLAKLIENLRASSIYELASPATGLTTRQRLSLGYHRVCWYLAHVRDAILARDCGYDD